MVHCHYCHRSAFMGTQIAVKMATNASVVSKEGQTYNYISAAKLYEMTNDK